MKIVLGHSNADFDAFACMVAITRLYDDVLMIEGRNMTPPVQRFLALHKDVYTTIVTEVAVELAKKEGVEKVFIVDTADSRRVEEFSELLDYGAPIELYDHHPSTDYDIVSDCQRVEPIGACITILVEKMIHQDLTISRQDATLYMLALYSDTGRLSYSTTTPRDIKVAAHLLKKGANLRVVNRYLSKVFSEEQVKLLAKLLDTIHEVSISSVEIAICFAEFDFNVRGAAQVVQQVMDFGGHSSILAFIRTKNRVMIIGRSSTSYVNIGKFLKQFGGGGHPGAGSAALKNEPLNRVMERVLKTLSNIDLHPIRVYEIMSKPIYYLDSEQTIEDAMILFDKKHFRGAPIKKGEKVVGVFSRRDARKASRKSDAHLPVSSYMTAKVESIGHAEPIDDALDMMTEKDVGRLLVTKENHFVGIITRSDLMRKLYMAIDPLS